MCYEEGIGVERDFRRAAALYERAANGGDVLASYYLANLYHLGRGVEENPEKELALYRYAAEAGHAGAQCQYGYCLQLGRGCERNPEAAFAWYQRGMEGGNATACNNLAAMLEDGEGCEKDRKRAAELYEQAYSMGAAKGAYNLGRMYRNGIGVRRSEKQAAAWFQKALDAGCREAAGELKKSRANQKVLYWVTRIFAAVFALLCFAIGASTLDGTPSLKPQDLLWPLQTLVLTAALYYLAWRQRAAFSRKKWLRILHGAAAVVLGIVVLAMAVTFAGSGLADAVDLWFLFWLILLTALALYRALAGRK